MKRVVLKIGDVFSVSAGKGFVKFFQYIGDDVTQLNSNVIKIFIPSYEESENLDLNAIAKDDVDCYAHCFLRLGININCWTKVGNSPIQEDGISLFRDTYDYGRGTLEEPILISYDWVVWYMGQPFKSVGKLEGEHQKADIGLVMAPHNIVYRMLHGAYDETTYPSF